MDANATTKAPIQEARPVPVPVIEAAQPEIAAVEISSVEADEQALERFAEAKGESPEAAKKDVADAKVEAMPMPTMDEIQKIEKDTVMVEVEKILEDGLADHWKTMPDALKPLFKQKGEAVAKAIAGMIKQSI